MLKRRGNPMKLQKNLHILFLVALILAVITGCSSKSNPITGSDMEAVLAFSEENECK